MARKKTTTTPAVKKEQTFTLTKEQFQVVKDVATNLMDIRRKLEDLRDESNLSVIMFEVGQAFHLASKSEDYVFGEEGSKEPIIPGSPLTKGLVYSQNKGLDTNPKDGKIQKYELASRIEEKKGEVLTALNTGVVGPTAPTLAASSSPKPGMVANTSGAATLASSATAAAPVVIANNTNNVVNNNGSKGNKYESGRDATKSPYNPNNPRVDATRVQG